MKVNALLIFIMSGIIWGCTNSTSDNHQEIDTEEIVIEDYEPVTMVKSWFHDLINKDIEKAKKKVTDDFLKNNNNDFDFKDGLAAVNNITYFEDEIINRTENEAEVYLRFRGIFETKDTLYFELIFNLNRENERWLIDYIYPAEGKQIFYDSTGNVVNKKHAVTKRIIYLNPEGKILGLVKEFYVSGGLAALYDMDSINNISQSNKSLDKYNGECVTFHNNGNKFMRYTVKNGVKDGVVYIWDEQEKLIEETEYSNGIKEGLSINYYTTGRLKTIKTYENGIENENVLSCDEQGNCQFVFTESFNTDKNNNNWSFIDNIHNKIIPGKGLQMETKPGMSNYSYTSLPVDYNNNFYFETVIKLSSNSKKAEYGLIWGGTDTKNYNYFLIKNGKYKIGFVIDGTDEVLVDWTKEKAIHKKNTENLLKIIHRNKSIFFEINNKIVHSDNEAFPNSENNIGFYTSGSEVDVIFSKLEIRQTYKLSEGQTKSPSHNIREWKGNGSGFIIDKRGYIVTNYHVIEDAEVIEISFNNNQAHNSFNAIVVVKDEKKDLAILKIDDSRFHSFSKVQYNFSTAIKDVGSDIFTLGYPMALSVLGGEIKFTSGRISAKSGYKGDKTLYQISVPVQPGNSGGPLFDNQGNLIGIVNAKINEADNVSFAIKSRYLYDLLLDSNLKLKLPEYKSLETLTLTEQIKLLSNYIVMIKVK